MEFEWENSSGKVDPNSPFRMSGFQRTLAEETPVKRGTYTASIHHMLERCTDVIAGTATQSVFESSPIKQPTFATPTHAPFAPSTPHRRQPAQSLFETPAFRTPRRSFASPSKDSDVFSTPGETDSEAPTPDVLQLRSNKKSNHSGVTAATPGRVTGRGELRRGSRHSISKPQRRRRRAELDQASDDDDDGSGPETDYGFSSTRKAPRTSRTPRKPKRSDSSDWLEMHQRIPVVASAYLRLSVHASWVALVIYILFACFRVVQQDMAHRVYEAAESVSLQIAECTKNYLQNRCAPDTRVPATEAACAIWEKCMAQDPAKVGRAKVSAATIAEILNGFVSELHWKTIVCISTLFPRPRSSNLVDANEILGLFLSRSGSGLAMQQGQYRRRIKRTESPAPLRRGCYPTPRIAMDSSPRPCRVVRIHTRVTTLGRAIIEEGGKCRARKDTSTYDDR